MAGFNNKINLKAMQFISAQKFLNGTKTAIFLYTLLVAGLFVKLNKMVKVKQKENETRKNYLIRVAIVMLNENGYSIDAVEYDEAECDAFCLAEDLRIEFDVEVD